MGSVTYPTLEHVAQEARPYPTHLLEDCETGLVLFASAFCGHNDAIHIAEAGIRGTCVDIDEARLAQMRDLYPVEWTFYPEDAWEFAEQSRTLGNQWDIVSLDPFTGEMMERVAGTVDLWCSLARRYVVMGAPYNVHLSKYPDEWRVTEVMGRSSIASWLVLTRES